MRRVYVGGRNPRIELTFSLPCWFGSLWAYSLLLLTLIALLATVLRDGLSALIPSVVLQALTISGIVAAITIGSIGIISIWLE